MPIKSEVKQESDATIKKVEEDRGLTIQVSFLACACLKSSLFGLYLDLQNEFSQNFSKYV